MKKVLFLIATCVSVSFNIPSKKVIQEETKNEHLSILLFKYPIAK